MSNVVNFPDEPKIANLTQQISNLQDEITSRYDLLTEHYVKSRIIEQECTCLQERFDSLVLQYSALHGADNIPKEVLEHCTLSSYDVEREEIVLDPSIQAFVDTIASFFRKL